MKRLCHLPDEIVMEILLRLPPESLIRFKCVCKSWYALISDPSFADKHLHFNNNRISSSISLFLNWLGRIDYGCERVQSLVTISDNDDGKDSNDNIPCLIEDLDVSIIPFEGCSPFCRASHCNGIIWLAPFSFELGETILYNPTIKEFKFLPKTCLGPRASSIGRFIWVQGEGFGFDSKANDYKFIRILKDFLSNDCIAEVYTMASDSWREIQIDIKVGDDLSCNSRVGVCCKGVIHWVVTMLNRILTFDLSSDEFHSVPLPAPYNVEQVDAHMRTWKNLTVWNESVALLISGGVLLSIEIWVMNDYHVAGVKAPWTKHLSIGPLENLLYYPIMFWKSDELLMGNADEGIVSYNLSTQKFRNLPIGVASFCCDAYFYTKSLVSVKRGN